MNTLKKDNRLNVLEYEHGIVLPQKIVPNGPLWGLGGVCDAENCFSEVSSYDGGWATQGGYYDWIEEEYCDEDVVYIGLFFTHWGHFLIDLSGRMWFLQQLAKSRNDFKVAFIGDEDIKGNYLAFFNLLGVKEEQLLRIQRPTRFNRVLVPELAFRSCKWYTDEFVNMLDEMSDVVMKNEKKYSSLQNVDKVYFTRKKFAKAIQVEFGEGYFEACLTENGYEAIAPETLSLEEQIYLWNHANEIVCINGTIPLNVMFSKNFKMKLIVLNKTSIFHENPYILFKMRGVSANFIDIYKEPLKTYPKSLGRGPFLLWPSEQFDKFCVDNKFSVPVSNSERYWYFVWQQVRYYWRIIMTKLKLREKISKLVPQKVKNIIKT